METAFEQKLTEMWHPTGKWCHYVAFALEQKLQREYGVIPYLLRMIRNMLPSSKLARLWLSGNQIDDAGAIKLAEALPNSNLTELFLSDNQITDAGAMKLAEVLPHSKLTGLELSNNQITDAGAIKLAEMLPNSKLTRLWLSGNQMTEVGMMKLAEALPNSKLTRIQLWDIQITNAVAIMLKNIRNSHGRNIEIWISQSCMNKAEK